MIKVFLRNAGNFYADTLDFYNSFAEIVGREEDADVVVINDFEPIESEKPVACNSTGLDHIKSPEIISLRGEDLRDFTAVPELCLGMMICLTRTFKGEEVRGKTLGVIGYGRIGHRLGIYAEDIGMNLLRYDSHKAASGLTDNTDLDTLLKNSDIVSIHITADEQNRGYFDKPKFDIMKNGAIFLNSSRPWLVDYEALKEALDNKLSVAWFDFEIPFEHPKLRTTPHLGGTTKESKKRSELIIAQKIKQLYGERA